MTAPAECAFSVRCFTNCWMDAMAELDAGVAFYLSVERREWESQRRRLRVARRKKGAQLDNEAISRMSIASPTTETTWSDSAVTPFFSLF